MTIITLSDLPPQVAASVSHSHGDAGPPAGSGAANRSVSGRSFPVSTHTISIRAYYAVGKNSKERKARCSGAELAVHVHSKHPEARGGCRTEHMHMGRERRRRRRAPSLRARCADYKGLLLWRSPWLLQSSCSHIPLHALKAGAKWRRCLHTRKGSV